MLIFLTPLCISGSFPELSSVIQDYCSKKKRKKKMCGHLLDQLLQHLDLCMFLCILPDSSCNVGRWYIPCPSFFQYFS